ncbi:MAG: O-antigen ligase family protein, partial [bacterium]
MSPAHRLARAGAPFGPWLSDAVRLVFSRRAAAMALLVALGLASAHLAVEYRALVALVLFLGMLGGIGVVAWPFLGVLAYVNLALMRPQEVFWGLAEAHVPAMIAGATILAALIHFAMRPNAEFLRRKQNACVLVIWAFLWLSTAFGDFGVPQPKWMDFYHKMFVMYFVLLSLTTSEKRLYVLAWVITASIGYLAIWANEMHFRQGLWVVHGPGREGSTFYDENDFAMILLMCVPLLWHLMRHVRSWLVKLPLLAMLPVVAHAIFVTFSRGGFLGLVAVCGFIAMRERSRTLAVAIVVAGFAFFAVVAGDQYRDRLGSIQDYEQDSSAVGRLQSWQVGTRMALANPLFGVGLKRYTHAFPHYSTEYEPRVAHNSWIQLAAEAGLVAVLAYG